jgi:hypothetical protein
MIPGIHAALLVTTITCAQPSAPTNSKPVPIANIIAGASILNFAFVIWVIAHFDYRFTEIRNVLMDRLPPGPPSPPP